MHPSILVRISFIYFALLFFAQCSVDATAQSLDSVRPIVGLRESPPTKVALVNAAVTIRPRQTIQAATILIDGCQIVSVDSDKALGPDVKVIDCTGKHVYPGLIDAYFETDVAWSESTGSGNHWNAYITPRRLPAVQSKSVISDLAGRRQQGIAAVVVAPSHRIIKGRSVVELLTDDEATRFPFPATDWLHLQLTVPRDRISGQAYPSSPMGATALVRQTLYDAMWYAKAWRAHQASADLPRPEFNRDLDSISHAMEAATFVFDAPNERMALRAGKVASEFSLGAIMRGSGREYRELEAIAAMKKPVLVPVKLPDAPKVFPESLARDIALQTLLHWHHAASNAGLLSARGVPICLTSDGLKLPTDFLKNVRRMVAAGLPPDDALAAMTTTPARLLKIDQSIGTIQPGKLANLFVTDRPWLDEKAKVTATFVAGREYQHDDPSAKKIDPLVGQWLAEITIDGAKVRGTLQIENFGNEWTANWIAEAQGEDEKDKRTPLENVVRNRHRFAASFDQANLGEMLGMQFPDGTASIEIVTVGSEFDEITGKSFFADGTSGAFRLNRRQQQDESADSDQSKESQKSTESESLALSADPSASIPILHPLGAYGVDRDGVASGQSAPSCVLFRGGTIWTCGDRGVQDCDVIVRDGVIAEVGQNLDIPQDCQVVQAAGKHITPGLIDCHSHIATDGGINESGRAVTAEVRIGDFIDHSDISIFRQLAGGVTTSNILHGSSNPIGGQNLVIKMRWGQTMDRLRFEGAPKGIKFALGENVKRRGSSYPDTRMGVEQLIRDRFLAARQYAAARHDYQAGRRDRLPVRRDLQLEALAEVQSGQRWIHCHSYRQDEILATLNVLEEFHIQIGTLQHVLEGYKVADAMARHGAMASSFSDWWAFKFEAFDAIPYNGVLLHDAGVVVSYNSDDAELGRHLNTEAAKAVKYGGVDPVEALKFVTLNPAKQLRIDDRVGSIQVGKDADLVLWSGPPLSTTSRCEQTWIDGRCYFSVDHAGKTHARDKALRRELIQLVLRDGKPLGGKQESEANPCDETEIPEEDRWLRYDEFCTTRGKR